MWHTLPEVIQQITIIPYYRSREGKGERGVLAVGMELATKNPVVYIYIYIPT